MSLAISGRAPRSEYWYWVLFLFIAGSILGVLDGLVVPTLPTLPAQPADPTEGDDAELIALGVMNWLHELA